MDFPMYRDPEKALRQSQENIQFRAPTNLNPCYRDRSVKARKIIRPLSISDV